MQVEHGVFAGAVFGIDEDSGGHCDDGTLARPASRDKRAPEDNIDPWHIGPHATGEVVRCVLRSHPMSRVTEDEIRSLASLARLRLSESEVSQLGSDLEGILEHMDALAEVDTEGVVPMSHVLGTVGHLRGDEIGPSLASEEALAASPSHSDEFFDVPAILPSGSGK